MSNHANLEEAIYQLLVEDLTRLHPMPQQVASDLNDKHNAASGQSLEAFMRDTLPTLDDVALDLLFSPMFTPSNEERVRYMAVIGEHTLDGETIHRLCERVTEANLSMPVSAPSGETANMPIQQVSIDRYVPRLNLDKPLPEKLAHAIFHQNLVPDASRPLANLLFRDALWQSEERQSWALAFLNVFAERQNFSDEKLNFLTDFIRTYRPNALSDLPRQLEHLIKSCEKDTETLPERVFHDQELKEAALETENMIPRQGERDRVEAFYNHQIRNAKAILDDLQAMPQQQPSPV
jgi:hypothetical protein